MPPKSSGDSKKVEKKKQEKIIQDKTFGLKNKNKSKVVQNFVKTISQQVQNHGKSEAKLIEEEFEKKKAKKAEEERQALLASLFKTVDTVKNIAEEEKSNEPTIKICQFFKQGLCNKGKKCKLSHEIQKEKIDIYTDQRIQNEENDDIDEWDEQKLQDVIKSKEQQYKKQCQTEIICKFFLDAVEKSKYGWKWMCPNGFECHYRHCLPPGYALRKDLGKKDEKKQDLIEDLIDKQREKIIKSEGTPVTLERFIEWKKKRLEKKAEEEEKKKQEIIKKSKGQKKIAGLTGRALFVYDPTLFQDDEDAVEEDQMLNREEIKDEEENEQANEEMEKVIENNNEDEDEEQENEEQKE